MGQSAHTISEASSELKQTSKTDKEPRARIESPAMHLPEAY